MTFEGVVWVIWYFPKPLVIEFFPNIQRCKYSFQDYKPRKIFFIVRINFFPLEISLLDTFSEIAHTPLKVKQLAPKRCITETQLRTLHRFYLLCKAWTQAECKLLTEVHVPYYTLISSYGLSFRSCCYVLLCRQCWTCSSCACWVKRTYLHKRVWPGGGHDSNSACYLFRIPLVPE